MDSISQARLQLVAPALSLKVYTLDEMLAAERIFIRVTQGLRSWSEQNHLHAKGRTEKSDICCVHDGIARPVGSCKEHPLGATVTNCPGGHSYHNFGMAVDVVPDLFPDDKLFTPDWNLSHPTWKRIVAVGESLDLNSGAMWRTRPDWPHLQLNGRFPEGSPNDEVRQIFRLAGMEAVWKEAGIAG